MLYKYFPSKRISNLERRFFRFTQPSAFSDPFEAEPYVLNLGDPERVCKIVQATLLPDLNQVWMTLPDETRSVLSLDELRAHIEANSPRLIEPFLPRIIPELRRRLSDLINRTVGILSLTEVPDDLLMWSHYADGHRGFVIGFDSNHEFFNTPGGERDNIVGLKKVEYSSNRPGVSWLDLSATEAFLIKSSHWEYEREWRCLAYLNTASDRDQSTTPPVYLFEIPGDAIRSIICGCRMSPDDQRNTRGLIQQQSELRHVSIMHAAMCEDEFRMMIYEETV